MSGLLKYEWLRFATMRSTYVFLGIIAAVTMGIAFLMGWLIGNLGGSMPRVTVTGPGIPFSMLLVSSPSVLALVAIFLGVLSAQAIGQEYRTGMIRVTLTQFPSRIRVLSAKSATMLAIVAAVAVASIALVWAVGSLGAHVSSTYVVIDWSTGFGSTGDGGLLLRCLLYVVIFAGFSFALTLLTRNMPVGIIIPIVLAVFVEPIIRVIVAISQGGNFDAANDFWLVRILPFTNGSIGMSTASDAWTGTGIFAVWLVALLIPGWLLFLRRDA